MSKECWELLKEGNCDFFEKRAHSGSNAVVTKTESCPNWVINRYTITVTQSASSNKVIFSFSKQHGLEGISKSLQCIGEAVTCLPSF